MSSHSWMQTYSGGVYCPASPRAQDVRIVDIAHHLSMLCRYTGACKRFYSVAEHSVLVSQIVPIEFALEGLLHDATEAYVNDLSRPLKHSWLMWGYRWIEYKNWKAICEKFDLLVKLPAAVTWADNVALRIEQAALMRPSPREPYMWGELPNDTGTPCPTIHCWPPEEAELKFLERFYQLTRGRGRGVAAGVAPGPCEKLTVDYSVATPRVTYSDGNVMFDYTRLP